MVMFVLERREELITEGGLDVMGRVDEIAKIAASLRKHEVTVSLFIDPDLQQVKAALRAGVRFVEFHTGAFCSAHDFGGGSTWEEELGKLRSMTQFALKSGLEVNMGHGLNYRNVRYVSEIEGVWELNIGHAIVGRAVLVGFERAVKEMLALMR